MTALDGSWALHWGWLVDDVVLAYVLGLLVVLSVGAWRGFRA